jgi:hypothetical protein
LTKAPQCRDGITDNQCKNEAVAGMHYCAAHDPYQRLEEISSRYSDLRNKGKTKEAGETLKEKTDLVLRLIEEHPEGKLELPARDDGVRAELRRVDPSSDTLWTSPDEMILLAKPTQAGNCAIYAVILVSHEANHFSDPQLAKNTRYLARYPL